MKILIAGLFSALLLWAVPAQAKTPTQNLNNSVASFKKQTVQAKANESKPIVQEPSPQLSNATVSEAVQEIKPVQTYATGSHEDLMSRAGIPKSDWAAVSYIVSHESSWRTNAREPHTHAYGLCQALPRVKMASAGDDYMTNPVTQLQWCNSYAHTRYGSWQNAAYFWRVNRWW